MKYIMDMQIEEIRNWIILIYEDEIEVEWF